MYPQQKDWTLKSFECQVGKEFSEMPAVVGAGQAWKERNEERAEGGGKTFSFHP